MCPALPTLVAMRIARFSFNESPRYAFVQTDESDGKDYLVELDGHPLLGGEVKPTGNRYPVDGDGIRLLAPVIPSKIYGLGKNYEAHAQFMHEAGHSEIAHAPEDMVIFAKPSTSVIGPDDPIVIPSYSNDMNYEPEVAVVIGRIAKNVPVERAMDYVLGFTCTNDVTLRDLQGLDPMWTRAKGFDTACPLGPWIVSRDELDWRDAKISFTLNGEDVPQANGTTANLIHGIPEQIAAISSFATLLPGDVILTGTPHASGQLNPGDEAIVNVEGIGSLRNIVVRG
ncbi:2-hydroxyhepta-2,4-diene-1,7-dioate isomerase [Bifidobacterium eulemuris]|uniref:2-hydroxyhepta-2,4-diene-1,7-dioate isomerase n=2 Tax=Bifidobacterium eulemuris TaxID=1765219 RepID=A0A261GDP6_9BIFI|nr:2-hydroxyhepta-2,4-diene-1,7-dioate isomerase [Bifidobacterium eulemuris]